MRKVVILCLLMFLLPAYASAAPISVKIDNKNIQFDQAPMIKNGRTLVPLRGIFEALGAQVLWNDKERSITATKDNKTIILKIGSNFSDVSGKTIKLDQEPIIINGRTLVPLRFIGESLGSEVNWDAKTRTVMITPEPEVRIVGIE